MNKQAVYKMGFAIGMQKAGFEVTPEQLNAVIGALGGGGLGYGAGKLLGFNPWLGALGGAGLGGRIGYTKGDQIKEYIQSLFQEKEPPMPEYQPVGVEKAVMPGEPVPNVQEPTPMPTTAELTSQAGGSGGPGGFNRKLTPEERAELKMLKQEEIAAQLAAARAERAELDKPSALEAYEAGVQGFGRQLARGGKELGNRAGDVASTVGAAVVDNPVTRGYSKARNTLGGMVDKTPEGQKITPEEQKKLDAQRAAFRKRRIAELGGR